MENYLVDIHSIVAYIFLIATTVLLVISVYRHFNNQDFSVRQEKLVKTSFISAHIQLLLGLIIWVMKGHASLLFNDTSAVMKTSSMRLTSMEHPLTNIIAIAIITIGYLKLKKNNSNNKNKLTMIYFGIALLLILSRIPWSQWLS